MTTSTAETVIVPYPAWAKLPVCQELFGLSKEEIRAAADAGQIKRHSKGTRVLYRCKDIDAYLDAIASGRKAKRAS